MNRPVLGLVIEFERKEPRYRINRLTRLKGSKVRMEDAGVTDDGGE